MRTGHSRGARIPCWLALVALSVAAAAHGAAPREYTQVTLRELPHQGALSDRDATLAEPSLPDPPGVPADCTRSWFRRHIARVVQARVIVLDDAGLFHPQQPVAGAEFAGWLGKVAPARARRILDEYGLARPEILTREQAFAATARFLWGDDPAAALAACPPPAGRSGAGPATLWRRSFHGISGSEEVRPDLEPYLLLALAKGLLYDEPALNATGGLTREVAAWLLDHCLPPDPGDPTGVIVDVVDVPFVVDSTGWSSRGAGLLVLPDGESGAPRRVYPADSTIDRLPDNEISFPSVYCTPSEESAEASGWLASRVGENPLHIIAQGVVSESGRGRQVAIAPADAEALRKWNERRGLLDNWRVACRYGVGARLLTPLEGPTSREPTFTIRFNQQMSADAASDRLVWLRPAGEAGARAAAAVAWRQPGWELAIRPAAPLAPGREYELVLAANLRNAKGEPITVRDERLRAAGLARCWRFTTDPRLRVHVGISGVPDGTKVYLPDRAGALVTPLRTSPLVLVKPGPLEVRFETPDGGHFAQSQTVAEDCTIRLPLRASPPSQVRVEGIPEEMAPGQQVVLTLRAADTAGAFLSQATPVTVTAEAKGCVVVSGPSVTLERGEGRLVLSAEKPGKVVVTLSSSDAAVPVRPRQVVAYCRYSPPTEAAWSPVERHLLPPAARGARDVQITPRWRRWLALGAAHEVRVVEPGGGEFSRIPQVSGPPGSREFWVDDLGVLHFPAAAAGTTVDLSYQYREPRCAAVVVGLHEGDPLRTAVEAVLADVFGELGYQQVATAELAAAWGGGDPAAHVAAVEEVGTAMRVFGLTDLFVLALGTSEGGSYQGAWTIWTAEAGPVTKWASGGPEAPVMSIRGRRADAAVEAAYLRRELMQSLRPWLAQKGMEASRTLVRTPPQ